MWQIEQSTAHWVSHRLRLSVDLTRPTHGFHHIALEATELPDAQVLQISIPGRDPGDTPSVEDVYVRGSDAIVTYAAMAHNPVHPQVYWRVVDQPHVSPVIILEALVSVQTPLLDSDPRVQLHTTLAGNSWWQCTVEHAAERFHPMGPPQQASVSIAVTAPGIALLARMAELPYSYGHIIHAADLIDAKLTWDPARKTSTLSTLFFGQRLEKGVLRRVRARAILAPRSQDEALLGEQLLECVGAAPPLTT
ncbi:MAG: hypothetical protein ACYC0X_26045 [Pirellulaceae bacterium]